MLKGNGGGGGGGEGGKGSSLSNKFVTNGFYLFYFTGKNNQISLVVIYTIGIQLKFLFSNLSMKCVTQ